MITTFSDVSGGVENVEPDRAARTEGWAEQLVAPDGEGAPSVLVGRALSGLGLAALYGLAIGARQGGASLVHHALGVPFGLLLVVLLGTPSMFVFLSLCKAHIAPRALAATTARGIASAGLLLAGLAPAALLFVVSSETPQAARGTVALGLLLGGGLSLARTTLSILREAAGGSLASLVGGTGVALGFATFAVALAMRVWTAVLPILHLGAHVGAHLGGAS